METQATFLRPARGVWRTLPFGLAAIVVPILAFAGPPRHVNAPTLVGIGLVLLVALASLLRPSRGLGEIDILLPATFLVAVALLRHGGGGTSAGYNALVLVPVLWSAVHGDRTQLGIVLLGVAAVFVMPLVLDTGTEGPQAEWRSALLQPVLAAGIGVIVQELLHAFARQASAAEHRAEVLRARYAVTRILAGAPSFETTIPAVLAAIGESLRWPFGVFWRVHHRKAVLRPATVWQEERLEADGLRTATADSALAAGEGLPGRAWEECRPVWGAGAQPAPGDSARADAARRAGLGAAVAVPVRHGKEVVGVVEFLAPRLEVPDAELSALLDDLSILLEQLIERVEHGEQLSQLEAMARTEELTGLPNRRAWEETLPRELARARRNGRPLCVVLLDLDHFKLYNDSHGHLAGDALLRSAAKAWRVALRTSDFIARFGGDEFAALLPDCSLEQAATLVERLRAASPAGHTCSAGVAQWDPEESAAALLRRADVALYEAKDAGRDRVRISAA
jgi:diguanylate cyclase (GGDEF)-like protein